MEVGGIDHLGPAFVDPDFLIDGLAVRAAAVTAGTVMYFDIPALRAPADIVTEPAGPAVQDGRGGFALQVRDMRSGSEESLIGGSPDPLNGQVTHERHLPSGRTG